MSIPQVIPNTSDPDTICSFSLRWGISLTLAERLTRMTWGLEFPVSIISGLRTARQQDGLRRSGRPAAPNDKSTHLNCPATGADLSPAIAVTDVVKARLGAEGVLAGLRWGGGSPTDPDTGIPSDWRHFDLGPRN